MNYVNQFENELIELYDNKVIKSGLELNKRIKATFNNLNGKEVLNCQVPPTYNFLNLDKPTVFCHLNPGCNSSIKDFQNKLKKYNNAQDFIANYKEEKKFYPKTQFLEKKQFDNFDYKQALYLSGFSQCGITFNSIQEKDLINDNEMRLRDCYNVLTQKTQLELIPFESKSFKGIFNSISKSKQVFTFIEPYFINMMDIIIQYPREYVIFGSKQYDNLFRVANNKFNIIKRKSKKVGLEIGTKNKAYVTILKLNWKGKEFDAVIAHSFPRQDLPNAFNQMRLYGKLSYEFLKNHTNGL